MKMSLTMTAIALAGAACAQLTFRNAEPVETDSQGHVIEKLDYDRKISVQEGSDVPTAAEYRAELKERERMKKVAREVGPWFDAIQRLEIDQKKAEEEHADDGGGEAGDGAEPPPGQTGAGMLAYIEAIRLFNTDTSEGGKTAKEAKQLKAALEELLYRRGGEVVCGPGHGVSLKWPLELLLVRYQSWKAQSLPMDELYAAKSADLWPGKVPADAERVRKKVRLYPGEGGWISTGLYVPPGEVVTIDCGSLTGSLTAQIGCHTDNLPPKIVPLDEDGNPMDDPYDPQPINLMKVKMGWQQVTDNRPLWRWPLMTRSFRIEKKREEIGHVLGGVLWFRWSGGKRPMDVEVSGCVQMPWFRLGIDTDQDWVETISKYPAPWAEIQTKTVILTVPSEDVRHITRMEALAQWWGKAAALMLRLSGHDLPTDTEAANYRGARRQWGVLNKKLVQMTPDAPPDTEELVRAADAAKAAAPKPEPGADSPHDYGIEPEPIAQQPVPQDPRAPRALKKPSRENEPKFTPIRIVDDTQINLGAGPPKARLLGRPPRNRPQHGRRRPRHHLLPPRRHRGRQQLLLRLHPQHAQRHPLPRHPRLGLAHRRRQARQRHPRPLAESLRRRAPRLLHDPRPRLRRRGRLPHHLRQERQAPQRRPRRPPLLRLEPRRPARPHPLLRDVGPRPHQAHLHLHPRLAPVARHRRRQTGHHLPRRRSLRLPLRHHPRRLRQPRGRQDPPPAESETHAQEK